MLAVAMVIEALIGWPDWLYARIGHPVGWIGRLITRLETGWNRLHLPARRRRLAGAAAALLVIAVTLTAAALPVLLLPPGWPGVLLGGVLGWPWLAARSLDRHVAAVADPLAAGDLTAARRQVSRIVGRAPERLDEAGVARAAIESLAENTSDGVVAPLFWGLLGGLPGLAAYKAVNTLDSMIGHRTPRLDAFGWAAARTDDLVNLLPARFCGVWFALLSARPLAALRVMGRDARHHRSPNAGWPEGAMAGALGIRLSGPRLYADRVADEPWINAGARDPAAADIRRALAVYRRSMVLLWLGLLVFALWGGGGHGA